MKISVGRDLEMIEKMAGTWYRTKERLIYTMFLSTQILTVDRDVDPGLQLLVACVHGGAAVLPGVLLAQLLDEQRRGGVPGLLLRVHPDTEAAQSDRSVKTQ